MPSRTGGRRWARWAIGGVVVVVVLAIGIPFAYIHFIEGPAPAKFSLSTTASPGAPLSTSTVDGTWKIGAGSQAGYRVQEVLAGQNNTAVGRTSSVSGTMTIAGTKVSAAAFTVDLASVTSDSGQRDAQFNGRIMDTAQFPKAVFTLTSPISLGSVPRINQTVTTKATGTLAMHGVTKPVTATLEARDSGSAIEITGEIPVVFASWNIANPSFGSFVKTDDNGLVEFKLHTTKG